MKKKKTRSSPLTSPEASEVSGVQVSGVGEIRRNLSLNLLISAANLSSEVGSLEAQYKDQPFGPFFDDILGKSSSCVVSVVAAAEAYINEIYVDREKWFNGRDQLLFDLLWTEIERKSIIDKYDFAVSLAGQEPLEKGATPYQDFVALIKLRNGLVHFIPEWPSRIEAHDRLSQKLRPYITRTQWLPYEPLFPIAWASYKSTSWAIDTVVEFVADFSEHADISDRFAKHLHKLDRDQ